jgi:hypothetical protein
MNSKDLRKKCEHLYRMVKAISQKKQFTARDAKMSELYFAEYTKLHSRMKALQRLEADTNLFEDHSAELKSMATERINLKAYRHYLQTGQITNELKALMPNEWLASRLQK